MVYTQRPVACRTYGFYVQRKLGLYCRDIESREAEGALVDVVWGNHPISLFSKAKNMLQT
jgi:Fe-S-cluster containining protein